MSNVAPMRTTLHVHFADALAPDEQHRLERHLEAGVQYTHGPLPDNAQFQVLVAGRPSHEALAASPHLRKLLIPFAGLPSTTRQALRHFPQIDVHNLHHNAPIVAEACFALLLAAAKAVVPIDRTFRHHDWSPRYTDQRPGVMLAGRTALILGYGQIGERVGHYCRAFGMSVLGIKRTIPADAPDFLHPLSDLHELLPQTDVLIIALPATPATEGLIGAAELALLRAKAIVVNIGRAAVVDEAAFYNALQAGQLHAAAADVWYQYPQTEAERTNTAPSRFPFHTLDNMVMSPHRSGHVDVTEDLRMAGVAQLLNVYARGAAMPNPVDLDAGY